MIAPNTLGNIYIILPSSNNLSAVDGWLAEGQRATPVGKSAIATPFPLPPVPRTPHPSYREAQYVTTLVKALSQRYPQSVYYTMRAFLLERREQPDRGVPSNTDSNKLPKAMSVRLPGGGTVSILS